MRLHVGNRGAINYLAIPLAVAAAGGATIAGLSAVTAVLVPGLVGCLALILLVRLLIPSPAHAARRQTVLAWTLGAFAAHLVFGLLVTNNSTALHYLGAD